MAGRRGARRAALFMLYRWDVTGEPLEAPHEGEVDPFAQETAEAVAARAAAIARALRALAEFEVVGVPTTIAAARDILRSEEFQTGRYSTNFLAEAGARLPAMVGAV